MRYLAAIGLVAAAALISWPLHGIAHLSDVAMIFVLAIVIAAILLGRGPALAASVAAVLAFDFFFVPPYLTFAVEHFRYFITFAVMITVGVVISTVADRARAEARRARQAEEEKAAERARSALLESVSHDLRTPLSVITGAATALIERGSSEDPTSRRELLLTVRDEAARLAEMVSNLLEMSRVESGALQLRREWHSIEELIGAAIAAVEARLGERQLRVDAPAELPLASVDGMLVQQVLINLLDNAIKHTPPGTPIDVLARTDGETIRIEVADRGPGIAVHDAARLFEKFQRASHTPGGFGLGLAIARALVEAHGGAIAHHAREGGGASFVVSLPTGGTPPRAPEPVPIEEPAS